MQEEDEQYISENNFVETNVIWKFYYNSTKNFDNGENIKAFCFITF